MSQVNNNNNNNNNNYLRILLEETSFPILIYLLLLLFTSYIVLISRIIVIKKVLELCPNVSLTVEVLLIDSLVIDCIVSVLCLGLRIDRRGSSGTIVSAPGA